MSYTISFASAYSGADSVETSKNVTVDGSFIEMLTTKFLNADIPDAYQDQHCQPFAQLRCGLLGEDCGQNIALGDINATVKRDLSEFKGMLDQALEAAGIDKDPSFEVKLGASGRLYIDSEHPDKETIAKILNETRNIRDTFRGCRQTPLSLPLANGLLPLIRRMHWIRRVRCGSIAISSMKNRVISFQYLLVKTAINHR